MVFISLKLAIIAAGKDVSIFYKKQLEYFFGDSIVVSSYSIEDNSVFSPKNEDMYLVTTVSFDCNEDILKYIPKDKTVIIGNVTFKNSTINRLKEYPINTKALLVNSSAKMAAETITLLYQKGVNNIQFYPYYPGCTEGYKNVDLAITPGETRYVPKHINNILDINNRVLDSGTLLEIATLIGCEYLLDTKRFISYFDELSGENIGMENLIEKNSIYTQQLSTITKVTELGIIGFDMNGKITSCNNFALEFLEEKRNLVLFKPVNSGILKDGFEICKKNRNTHQCEFLNKKNEKIKLSFIPILKNEKPIYIYALITKYNKNSSVNDNITNEALKKGHKGRYTFDDIITENITLIKTKEMAKKMAKTNSSILITGESGTGKELFAHSIHNYSDRRDSPFVAINCGALNETLLESELFGYEEGAFTGAKKGGKIGLFEIANNGTIFLDEIEGMSQNLQLKLLRVLQEKEIIKVGGDRLIPINVRVIGATNENIFNLVKEKKFRNDLYYRLNTLPININPLRDRIEDVDLLIKYFKKVLNFNFILTERTRKVLFEYNWPGNVRELKNCIEYFYCLNEKIIEKNMLPEYLKENNYIKFKENIKKIDELMIETLIIIKENNSIGIGSGRNFILKSLNEKGFKVTEAIVRKTLHKLNKLEYIISSKGRAGSKLTELGEKILENNQ